MLYINMHRTQIYFPKELHEDLKVAAKAADLSISEFIRKSLEERLYFKTTKKAKTRKENPLSLFFKNAMPLNKKDLSRNFDKYLEESLK